MSHSNATHPSGIPGPSRGRTSAGKGKGLEIDLKGRIDRSCRWMMGGEKKELRITPKCPVCVVRWVICHALTWGRGLCLFRVTAWDHIAHCHWQSLALLTGGIISTSYSGESACLTAQNPLPEMSPRVLQSDLGHFRLSGLSLATSSVLFCTKSWESRAPALALLQLHPSPQSKE